MRLLFVGDVVGAGGCRFIEENIYKIKKDYSIDVTVINGENSAQGSGIDKASADILSGYADVITTGNHCFKKFGSDCLFEENSHLIRPANFGSEVCGNGVAYVDMGFTKIAVINLMGVVYLEALDNPFDTVDKVLEGISTPNIFVDFHAEATSEKKVMGHYLSGRVTAVLGTHTHVQTADEIILKNHTAYITDVGMTGAELSVLGVDTEAATLKMKRHIPVRFTESKNPVFLNGAVVEFNEKNGQAVSIERIIVR